MIKENLNIIRQKLPSGVKLVAVSKFHPVSSIMEAYWEGQCIFAESRPQELSAKVEQLPKDIQWHFIGHLQTNKLKLVLPYAALVQSVDSLHLLEAINAWGKENGKVINVLLELHLGAEETKQGFSESELMELVPRCKDSYPFVNIEGLMGMATNTDDMQVVRQDFIRLEKLFHKLQALCPGMTELSAGMSGDWPVAVEHSATMVRIGTDIFGPREY